ncbi:MAG: hypothetical protein QM731_26260 [Chitinophagaceae bacterium]
MPNFDFHSTLSPVQFERLIRDILEIQFKGISFRTYAVGKDNGIDIKSTGTPEKIICQTKLYQNRFSQLIASLKKDVKKLKKHSATIYIIATSCTLTNANIQGIIELFRENEISIKENDIWDRGLLNQLLSQPAFKPVLKLHFNLFLTDITVLEETLHDIINNSILKRSIWELQKIKEEAKYYVETLVFKNALKRILDERVIILTGTAGGGKTTTAKMIINCLLNTLSGPKEFINIHSIIEAEDIYSADRQQIFLFDDYWGQFAEEVHEHHIGNRSALPDFVKRIRKSSLHYIIITSRDYIIANESIQKQQALKELIDENRIAIQVDEFNPQERAHIFIRHLYHSNYNRDFLTYLYVGDTLDRILRHANYNPRIVCEFIHKRFLEINGVNHEGEYEFYYHLKNHLDSPELFWYNLIKAQNDSARLLLFIIVISSTNNSQEEIRATFDRCIEACYDKGLNVSVKDFKEAERLLEDGFIELIPLQKLNSWSIRFKNGSIGDVVLQYLKDEATEWIPILLQGAIFFNQLTQNFTTFTQKEKTNKIILKNKNKSLFINKMLAEIWSFHDGVADLETPNFTTTMFIERLSKVAGTFDLNIDLEVRGFLIEKADRILNLIANESDFPFDRDNTLYLSSFFKFIHTWIHFNVRDFLEKVFYSIYYFGDYKQFLKFKLIYPAEFEQFLFMNKKKIKAQVRLVIIETADMLDEDAFDLMFDFEYYEILKGFKLRHSKLIEEELGEIGIEYFKKSFEPVSRKKSIRKRRSSAKQKERSEFWKNYNKKTKPYLKLINQYVAESIPTNNNFPERTLSEIETFHQQVLDQLCFFNPSIKRSEFLLFLKSLAKASYHKLIWYTEPTIIKLLKSYSEKCDTVNIDFSPAFQQQEKWYSLSTFYAKYLVSIYCKEESDVILYCKKIDTILEKAHPDDTELLKLLSETDVERFEYYFVIPVIRNFLSNIDFSDDITKATSCWKLANWSVDFTFKKSKGKIVDIDIEGSTGCNVNHIGILIRFLGIEDNFDFYGENIVDLIFSKNDKEPQVFEDFVAYCQKNITPEEGQYIWTDVIHKTYSIDISKELTNPDFLLIAKKCGWIKKLIDILDRLNDYASN